MVSTSDEILKLFKKAANEVMEDTSAPIDSMTLQSSIGEFGIDSLSIAEIVAQIEDSLSIRIADETLMEVRTLQDLVQAVMDAQKLKSR